MPTFDNLDALRKAIQTELEDIAKNEVLEAVQDEMVKHIDSDVYNKFSPKNYVRRQEKGGLSDKKNIVILDDKVVDSDGNVDMAIGNVTKGNSSYPTADLIDQEIVETIETGVGYSWKGKHPKKRPFFNKTSKDLKSKKLIKSAIEAGLKKRGLKAE